MLMRLGYGNRFDTAALELFARDAPSPATKIDALKSKVVSCTNCVTRVRRLRARKANIC
jgi:hypothetical protein